MGCAIPWQRRRLHHSNTQSAVVYRNPRCESVTVPLLSADSELIYNIDRPMYSSRMSRSTSKSDIIWHRKLEAMRLISSKLSQTFLEQKYSCLMRRIYTADDHSFQYNGGANSNGKIPNEVTAEKNVTSSLWVFQELSGDLPTPTPYSVSCLHSLITSSWRFWDWRMVRSIPKTRITSNTVQITKWEHN